MSETLEKLEAAAEPRTPFHLIGGEPGVRRLVDAFYDLMDEPQFAELRRMHAPDLSPMRARLADWLTGWMGGPRVYSERHPGRPCVVTAHKPFPIGQVEARQWTQCMREAFDAAQLSSEVKAMLGPAFDMMAEGLRNR